jgi:hypothetical protein
MRVRVLLPLVAAGCGVAFSPGDYGGSSPPAPAMATDGGVIVVDGGVKPVDGGLPVEAGPAGPERHLIVFASQSENVAGDYVPTADVWSAPLDDNGEIGTFGYMQAAPLKVGTYGATIAAGQLRVIAQGMTTRLIENADFGATGVTSAWREATVDTKSNGSFGVFFAHGSYVAIGGDEQVDDGTGQGTTVTAYDNTILVATTTGTAYAAPTLSATKLPVALTAVQAVTVSDFVYFWGDNGSGDDQRKVVYVGTVDDSLGIASIAATTAMPAVPAAPMACGGEGHLFIVGGVKVSATSSASIDAGTGKLGPWKAGPALPDGLYGGGCAVWNSAVHILGGIGSDGHRTGKILRSKFAADGTMAAWETLPQSLLFARSNVFAATY